jgi:type VI secretion system protein VasG
VTVRDDAIEAAAALSSRYISGRQLPDKAVDLLDTAAARVKVLLTAKPDVIEDKERTIQALEREKKALERDQLHGIEIDSDRYEEIEADLAKLDEGLSELKERWLKEQALVHEVIELRQSLYELKSGQGVDPSQEKALKGQIDRAVGELQALQGDSALVKIEVDPDIVSKVVSDWTGIPLGKVMRDEALNIIKLEENLKQRIKGQDEALDVIAQVIKSAKAGIKDPGQPLGVFLLVGPSGVGKTETGLAIADLLFGGENFMVTVNMSEFQEKHTVSRLIGSPPGYVGYGEGGVLTEGVRQRPYSVVLIDEVEKGHLEVMNLFYQVFDKGLLADGEGRAIDFKNTVIFLTSNLATDVITELCGGDEIPSLETVSTAIRPILSNHFKPALLARMTVVPYFTLLPDILKDIVILKMGKLVKRLSETHKMKLVYSDKVVDQIAARCTEVETGARNIDYIMTGSIMPRMSQEILSRMGEGAMPTEARLDMTKDGIFNISFKGG